MKHVILAAATIVLLPAAALPASAASDFYLKLDPIEGEAVTADTGGKTMAEDHWTHSMAKENPNAAGDHKGEIDIQSFSWGMSTAEAAGLATGKRMHKPMTISKPLERGSVFVRYASGDRSCAAGMHIATATLGQAAQRWKLKDVVISNCAADGMTLDYQSVSEVGGQ